MATCGPDLFLEMLPALLFNIEQSFTELYPLDSKKPLISTLLYGTTPILKLYKNIKNHISRSF